jgi:two-component system phosphate regulon sensor histidine kinase PhoR
LKDKFALLRSIRWRIAVPYVALILATTLGLIVYVSDQVRRARLAVLADAERVRQVVTNLVHNAIKFTPPGGSVALSAEQAGREVVIAVRDSGVGVPAQDLSRIFERFYKADRARSGGGSGLGLAIARHIVQAHGGRIWAESVEGQGSTFYFSLPLA